jgi:PAS domain S-box-containing protein
MSNQLHVLIVDDNPQDRALVIRELRKEFSHSDVRQVIDQAQLDQTLHDHRFDVVVTDYQLNWTNGIEVLRQVRSRYPDCPVLMFTATGNEEIAVEAMKHGLDDYIVKSPSHFVRLRAAVRAAMDHAQTRRRVTDLESRLELLLRRLRVGVFRCTADGKLLAANAPVLEFLGVDSLKDAASIGFDRMFVGCRECQAIVQHAIENGEPREGECEVRDTDGRSSYFRLSVVPVKTADDGTIVDGLLEDITQRKRSEAEARQAAIVAARMALLTPRERQVLDAVVAGKANKVIARDLLISEKTVEKHRANAMKKLQAKSIAELVRLALAAQSASQ